MWLSLVNGVIGGEDEEGGGDENEENARWPPDQLDRGGRETIENASLFSLSAAGMSSGGRMFDMGVCVIRQNVTCIHALIPSKRALRRSLKDISGSASHHPQ